MQQLKQLLTHKLKLLQQYRTGPSPELLLKEKRKQTSRDVIESRLLQLICSRRIEAPYRIQEFYNESLTMMKMYEPTFDKTRNPAPVSKEGSKSNDSVSEIVDLYVQFFRGQGCERRAEQLINIHQRNLCERGVIIPTLFNWFAQWLRKTFKEFIKKTLSQINEKKNSKLLEENKKNRNKKFMQQLSVQRASLSLIDSQIKLHKLREISLSGNKSKLLDPPVKQQKDSKRIISKSDLALFKHNQYKSLSKLKNNNSLIQQTCIQQVVDSDQLIPTSLSMVGIKQPLQLIKQRPVNSINLNKDIFFSAFYEEMGNYYKMNACLGELDENYPRNFRKVDRREEINKNLLVLVKSMSRNQPNQIRNTIQSYLLNYQIKYGFQQQKKRAQSEKPQKHTKRSQSVDINKSQKLPQKQERKANHSSQIFSKQRKSVSRCEAQKNKIELELPSINGSAQAMPPQAYRSVEKIQIAELLPNRYSKNNNKDRISAELYKQLRQINSLFRSKSRKKQKFGEIDEALDMANNNSIRFRSNAKDQIGELLDGNFDSNGVFRLPKIGK